MAKDNHRARPVALLPLCALAGLAPAGALAQGAPTTVFAGATFGEDELAYAGVTVPLPGDGGGGPAIRAIVSRTEYDYRSSVLGNVEGREVRGDVSALYQVFGPMGYFDIGLGARYVDTKLSPRDPGNDREGGQWEAVASLSGQAAAGPWRMAGFGSYGFDIHDYYARGEITHAIAPRVRLGAEASADGDRTYDRRRLGALLGFSPDPAWEIQLSAGGTDSDDHEGAYGAVAFRRTF